MDEEGRKMGEQVRKRVVADSGDVWRWRKVAEEVGEGIRVCGEGKDERCKGLTQGYRENDESKWRKARELDLESYRRDDRCG